MTKFMFHKVFVFFQHVHSSSYDFLVVIAPKYLLAYRQQQMSAVSAGLLESSTISLVFRVHRPVNVVLGSGILTRMDY